MCHNKGLDVLAEAFAILKRDARFSRLRLRVAGGKTSADDPYVNEVRAGLERHGLAGDAEFLPNLPFHERIGFLRSLTVLSVPQRTGEAAGRYLVEAWACGVPVVQPANGASVELVEMTGGGVLYERNDPPTLAEALAGLLGDPQRARRMGESARQAVREKLHVRQTADALLDVLRGVVERHGRDEGDKRDREKETKEVLE
jgi:glycosyltransferase involved in cell wall biosynthesis